MGGEPQHVQDPPAASHFDDDRPADRPADGRRRERQLEVDAPGEGGPASSRASDAPAHDTDRPAFTVYFGALLLTVVGVIAVGLRDRPWESKGLLVVLAWCGFCAAANMLPVPATRHISLSMGAPVNVAIAYLFSPGLAAAVVLVSSISEWEIRRQTTLAHAAFNRTQLAASTALASLVMSGSGPVSWAPGAWRVVPAVVTYQVANWGLVAVAEWTARGVPVRRVIRGLVPAGPVAAATYLVLGFMGVVLGLTSDRIGVWAVALLMLPLLGARHAVNASAQLEQGERERRALADRLIDERERERVRIASDIHDVVLQQLAALQLDADSIGAALDHQQPDVAVRLAGQLRGGVDDAIRELRATIASLRRATIEDGLSASLQRFARAFHVSSGIEVHVRVASGVDAVPLPVALLLFECCQEALTNAARHADASIVHVVVEQGGDTVELTVEDDGIGYLESSEGAVGPVGSGLVLTREKVELSGGLLFVTARPGGGTRLTVRVPHGAPG